MSHGVVARGRVFTFDIRISTNYNPIMARQLRLEFNDAFYHIISRGQRRENIFFSDKDREKFLKKLSESVEKYKIIIHLFVLLDNHYHLLIETPHGNIKKAMHFINTNYSNWFKASYKIVGSVFQGRYKSILVEKDSYLLTLSAYIHLNPVRARIVDDPEAYKWSSYPYYIGKMEKPDWLYTQDILSRFSNSQLMYKRFTLDWLKKEYNNKVNNLYGKNSFLGSQSYYQEVKKKIAKESLLKDDRELPDLKVMKSLSPEEIKKIIIDEFKISEQDLYQNRRNASNYRKLFTYCLKRYSLLNLKEIGNLVNLDYTGVSQLCKRFEDLLRKKGEMNILFDRFTKRLNKV